MLPFTERAWEYLITYPTDLMIKTDYAFVNVMMLAD